MTEELITNLSRIKELRVIARTSVMKYKNSNSTIAEISTELDVPYILEGSVRKVDEMVRITIQLIDAESEENHWTQMYDRKLNDILGIQNNIAQQVAQTLQMNLLSAEENQFKKRVTESVEAYDFYLRGREELRNYNESSMRKALDYFDQAIQIDPEFAEAYAGLGDCYYFLSNVYLPPDEAMPRALSLAQKALHINEFIAEAHATTAVVKAFYRWEWESAEEGFKRAIELKPSYNTARQYYGLFLIAWGRLEEAMFQLNQAYKLDPLSLSAEMTAVLPYYFGGQIEMTIEKTKRLIKSNPHFHPPYQVLGFSLMQIGEISRGIEKIEKGQDLSKNVNNLGYMGYAYAKAGLTDKAQGILKNLLSRDQRGEYIRPDQIALIYISLGEKDKAFEWLNKAIDKKVEELILLKVEPLFDSIRSDDRFQMLLQRMRLK